MSHYLWNESLDLLAAIPALLLIGTIGAWRWIMWLAKVIPALFYRPIANEFDCTATVVATVFDEDPALFRRGLESWIANAPDRLIAVIDVTDQACLAVVRGYPNVEVIINPAAGKRPGLVASATVDAADLRSVATAAGDFPHAARPAASAASPTQESRLFFARYASSSRRRRFANVPRRPAPPAPD